MSRFEEVPQSRFEPVGSSRFEEVSAMATAPAFHKTLPPPGIPLPEEEALQHPGSMLPQRFESVTDTPSPFGRSASVLGGMARSVGQAFLDPATLFEPETVGGILGAGRFLKGRVAQSQPSARFEPVAQPSAAPTEELRTVVPQREASAVATVQPPPQQPSVQGIWGRTKQAVTKLKESLPAELPMINAMPGTSAISDVERFSSNTVNRLDTLLQNPMTAAVWKYTPEQWTAFEAQAVNAWKAGGMTPEAYQAAVSQLPPDVQTLLRYRTEQVVKDQAARSYLGLGDIPEVSGPYFPRLTDQEARQVYDVFKHGRGLKEEVQQTVRSFQKSRTFETQVEGTMHGIVYEDPRKAWLLREWNSIKLQETAALMQQLEGRVLFKTREEAQAASRLKQAYPLEGLPGSQDRWWATSKEEARFLYQNLTRPEGRLGGSVHIINQLFRNPNLLNPLPHVVKNMAVKYTLAGGNPARLLPDAKEWLRGTNPQLKAEFDAVMPFTKHGETSIQMMQPYLSDSTLTKLFASAGNLNKPSSKFIFAVADPAMRYSLWKMYRLKGLSPQEAANNVWVDLIRYGTRSELVDTWKSIPMNFFVPWRVGTITSLAKQFQNKPFRQGLLGPPLWAATRPFKTALVLGTLEYLREMHYRETGRTFHMPADYVDGPVTKLLGDPIKAAYIAATWMLFGPGGEYAVKNLVDILNVVRGKEDFGKIKEMFWGIGQLYGAAKEMVQFEKDGNTQHLVNVLTSAALSEHDTSGYRPERLSQYLPEWMPAQEKAALVAQAEARRTALKHRSDFRKERQRLRQAATP